MIWILNTISFRFSYLYNRFRCIVYITSKNNKNNPKSKKKRKNKLKRSSDHSKYKMIRRLKIIEKELNHFWYKYLRIHNPFKNHPEPIHLEKKNLMYLSKNQRCLLMVMNLYLIIGYRSERHRITDMVEKNKILEKEYVPFK